MEITGVKINQKSFNKIYAKMAYHTADSPEQQLDIIDYAGKFASEDFKNKAAQALIVEAAQGIDALSEEVIKAGLTQMYFFLYKFVKKQCETNFKYEIDGKPTEEVNSILEDPIQESFENIFKNLYKYTPAKGWITTFCSAYIQEALDECRRKNMNYTSKTVLQTDRVIKKVVNDAEQQNRKLEIYKIAQKTGRSVEQVKISLERITANNSMTHLDSLEAMEVSSDYSEPEKMYIQNEYQAELINSLGILTEDEKNALFAVIGIEISGGRLENSDIKLKLNKTAEMMGISEKEVHKQYARAIAKLKNEICKNMNLKEKKESYEETVLSRHSVIFVNSEDDSDTDNFVHSIIEIREE